jgi:hypothetical protein
MQPTLLNSCAYAATAREAAYRIDAPPKYVRTSRVVALDAGAAGIVRDLAALSWHDTRFVAGFDAGRLDEDLRGADFVMMIATANDGATAASTIGQACAARGITTAGIVLGSSYRTADAVTALRPHARVLLVTEDPRDIAEILAEVGA